MNTMHLHPQALKTKTRHTCWCGQSQAEHSTRRSCSHFNSLAAICTVLLQSKQLSQASALGETALQALVSPGAVFFSRGFCQELQDDILQRFHLSRSTAHHFCTVAAGHPGVAGGTTGQGHSGAMVCRQGLGPHHQPTTQGTSQALTFLHTRSEG